jgi:hypothetical protein
VQLVRQLQKGGLVVIMAHDKTLDLWACGTGREAITRLRTEKEAVWLHIPAKSGRQLVVLREEPFVYVGHFTQQGCKPCLGEGRCKRCEDGFGKKTRVVFSMMDARSRETGVFEVSDVTGLELLREIDEWKEKFGCARGLAFVFAKQDDRTNGKIVFKPLHGLAGGSDLPDGPDPAHVLAKMWTSPERVDHRPILKELNR